MLNSIMTSIRQNHVLCKKYSFGASWHLLLGASSTHNFHTKNVVQNFPVHLSSIYPTDVIFMSFLKVFHLVLSTIYLFFKDLNFEPIITLTPLAFSHVFYKLSYRSPAKQCQYTEIYLIISHRLVKIENN